MPHDTCSCEVNSLHNCTCSVRAVPFSTTNYSWSKFTRLRVLPLVGLMWFTFHRFLRNHWKCHLLQIELNNWLFHMFQQSIKVSLIAVSVEQLIYLLITRCCVLPFLVITLQWHPCPLGRQNILTIFVQKKMLVHREESNYCSVLRITRVSSGHSCNSQMYRNLSDSLLFQRQFRSFVQNFCKRYCVGA